MSRGPAAEREHSIPKEVLDDLISRFVINADDLDDIIRVGFQIEKALWFYEDEYVEGNHAEYEAYNMQSCHIKKFMEHVINHCDFLAEYRNCIDDVYGAWQNYKQCIPTAGALILNEDLTHVLLCRSWNSKTSWGFPKGKSNEDEPMDLCAVREVKEETGFDISQHMDLGQFVHRQVSQQSCTLFVVPFIQSNTPFKPIAKKEIGDIQWFPVGHLPNHKGVEMQPNRLNLKTGGLFMVIPFVKPLKDWIRDYKQKKIKFCPVSSSTIDPRTARRQLSRREAARKKAIEEHTQAAEQQRRKHEASGKARKGKKARKQATPAIKEEPTYCNSSEQGSCSSQEFKIDTRRVLAVMETTPGWIV